MKYFSLLFLCLVSVLFVSCAGTPLATSGPGGTTGIRSKASARLIEEKARVALNKLYRTNEVAAHLAKTAEGVLVFPDVKSGGILIGGKYGDGALFQKGKLPEYYRSIAVNYGLHAGVEQHGYALFLMSPRAMRELQSTAGWELGSEPNITVIDRGVAFNASTTNLRNDLYAFTFDQKGLMAGLRFSGTKITRLNIR